MYDPNIDYLMPDEIISGTDNFIARFYALSSEENASNEAEHRNNLIKFNKLRSHRQTPLYLLDIAKRILVDNDTNCGNIIVITGLFDKIIEKQSLAQRKFLKIEENKNFIAKIILFLLPYAASFFEANDEIICFDNLFKNFVGFIPSLTENFNDLFNEYIESLFEEENIHHRIIGLYFVNEFMLNESNSEVVNEYLTEVLMNMKNIDFEDKLETKLYDILVTKLPIYIHNQLEDEKIDKDCFFQSITDFFDRFVSFNERLQEIEIEFIQKVISSLLNTIIFYFCKPVYFKFNSSVVGLVYEKAIVINRLSVYQLSNSISLFFLNNFKYFDFDSIMQNRQYFINLITQLTIYPLTKEITEPEEILFVDYYDINLSNDDIQSNRQNIALFLFECYKVNRDIIFTLFERILNSIPIEKVRENHFFLASIILRIVSTNIQNGKEFQYHCQFMLKFLEMSTSLHEENGYANTQKVFFEFTYLFLINSSFQFIKQLANNEEIIEMLNKNLFGLIELISTFSEDQMYDEFYKVYFTFFCIIANQMHLYNLPLAVPNDELFEFTYKYLPLCITSDAINLMNSIAVKEESVDLLLKTYDQYLKECYVAIKRFEEIMKLNVHYYDDYEEEEEEEFMERRREDIEEEEKDTGRVLRFINENVFGISQIIRQVDASNFDEENLKEFGELLIKTDDNQSWVLNYESIEYFSSLFFKSEEIFNLTEFYIKLITDYERFDCSEWSITITNAVSYHPELVDQNYFDMVSDVIVNYIEKMLDCGKMPTLDCLPTFSLITRLFEIRVNEQFVIQDEVLSYIMKFAFESLPTEEDIDSNSSDFILTDHKLGLNILILAYYLIAQEFDHNELIAFLMKLANEGQIVCKEMRYLIVMIIQELLKDDENEQLLELKNLCLKNTVDFNMDYRNSYLKNSVLLVSKEKHPIFDIYPIEGFVFE